VWRAQEDLPEDLVFHVNYLGGDMPTFTLNFSRAGNQIIGQYYNFLRLGRDGYTRIMQSLRTTAMYLSSEISKLGPFELLSDGSATPVFAFRMREGVPYTVYDLSDKMRERGWQVPAYAMAENAQSISVLRIVVRDGFSRDLADLLLDDLRAAVQYFESKTHHEPAKPTTKFVH
jgi:glutamate decarboxylase